MTKLCDIASYSLHSLKMKASSAHKKKVLVIEDDEPTNMLLVENLLSDGYQAFSALSGTEGVKIAFEEKPDLILLDMLLPGMDGWEVCRRLREKTAPTHKVPIIIISIVAKDKIPSGDMGPVIFFDKPFNINLLLTEINRLSAANNQ